MGILIEFPSVKQNTGSLKKAAGATAKNIAPPSKRGNSAQLLFFTGVRYERIGQAKNDKKVVV